MSEIDNPQRLKPEDFAPEQQELVGQIAELYNYFVENVTNIVNGRLDYDNLSIKDLITITVTVDASGVPTNGGQFTTVRGLKGTTVINAQNLTNSNVFPTAQPYISFTAGGTGTYTIKNIAGLPANNRFTLTLELTY